MTGQRTWCAVIALLYQFILTERLPRLPTGNGSTDLGITVRFPSASFLHRDMAYKYSSRTMVVGNKRVRQNTNTDTSKLPDVPILYKNGNAGLLLLPASN